MYVPVTLSSYHCQQSLTIKVDQVRKLICQGFRDPKRISLRHRKAIRCATEALVFEVVAFYVGATCPDRIIGTGSPSRICHESLEDRHLSLAVPFVGRSETYRIFESGEIRQ